jgi:hypothetical protein
MGGISKNLPVFPRFFYFILDFATQKENNNGLYVISLKVRKKTISTITL